MRASLLESVKKTKQAEKSPVKTGRLAKENRPERSCVQPLFTRVGKVGGIFDSALRTPIQCEADPSSLSSSQDNSHGSLSLLEYAQEAQRTAMMLRRDTYMGHQNEQTAPSSQMQALRGGANRELRRQLDILDDLPYQPCPNMLDHEDGIASYIPLRNSLASQLHPLDHRASGLTQH